MAKLYEILAVERDLNKSAQDEIKRVSGVFAKPDLLVGQNILYHALIEGNPPIPNEVTLLAHTVKDELVKLQKVVGSYVDVAVQKEVSNTRTAAIVYIDNEEFLPELPATALLNLETRLEEIRKAYEAIPTIDVTERWTFDSAQGCYVSAVRERMRTKKVYRNHVKAEATKEHPAQVEVYQEEMPMYRVETVIQSGMLTPVEKRQRLERITALQIAVKKARQRANDIDVPNICVAAKIFAYINAGVL